MFLHDIFEGLKDGSDNPCWKGYHPVGTKAIAKKKGQGVAEGQENYNGIDISMEIQKDDEYVDDEDHDNQVLYVTASSKGKELGHVLFAFDGEYLMPQDLEVEERYRGQGIAQIMYDYVKSKGYKIRRSGQQTDAGAGFWDKHKPGKNVWEQGVAEAATDDPKFQKMMGNIQKTTPDPFGGYVAVSYASEKPSKKIRGATVNGQALPATTDDPGRLMKDLKFTSDRIEQQLMAIGKKHGWDLIDPGQGQGYSELYFDTNQEYTTNTQRQLATNIVKTVNEINKFFASMNSSLQAIGLPGYRVNVWQGMGANGNTNQIDDINQITNIAKGKSAKSDPGPAIGKMILKYLPGYEAENDELGYDPKDFVDAKQVANIYITKGERAGLQAQHKLDSHVSEMIDELLSDHNGNSLRTIWDLDEQGVAEGRQSFSNGDQVELTPDYADKPGEVYTVSQCDQERGRCWIGDADGRGWYATFDQLSHAETMGDDHNNIMEDFGGSPVAGAITRRILMQRLDLLKQYGPELVGAAVDNVADYVGDVEEIGSSDVSGWVAQVERMLKENPPEAFAEGYRNYDDNRTGFRKPGADVSGEGEPEGMFMVMVDGRPWKEFTSNMAFQRAKTIATKNPNKTVQVKWPTGQLNTVKEDSWHGEGDAWHGTGNQWSNESVNESKRK